MSDQSGTPSYAGTASQMRTLAVRITDDLRAQSDAITYLNDRGVTEEIRLALEQWIERSKSDPKVLQRAETVRAEIEREAETTLFSRIRLERVPRERAGHHHGHRNSHLTRNSA